MGKKPSYVERTDGPTAKVLCPSHGIDTIRIAEKISNKRYTNTYT